MKVLTITSFYSGLRDSVLNNEWKPKGMPAVYKLLEGFRDAAIHFDAIMLADSNQGFDSHKTTLDQFPGSEFRILCKSQKKSLLRLIDEYAHFKVIMEMIISSHKLSEYDLIYIDRSNAGLLPFLKKNFKGKIVMRLHGVGTLYQNFQGSFKFRILNWWRKKGFSTKTDLLISSRDGTPVPDFIKRYVHSSTPTRVLLNGVDYFSERSPNPPEITSFLFVGRLENDKGVEEIVEAFSDLKPEEKAKCRLEIVGDGSLKNIIEKSIANEDHIKCHGQLSHKAAMSFYGGCQVVISINYLGNISNVVLEAIANETALITLAPDDRGLFDVETRMFLGENVMYVDRFEATESLSLLISKLLKDPSEITRYQNLVRGHLKPQLDLWPDRTRKEIDMLQDLCKA